MMSPEERAITKVAYELQLLRKELEKIRMELKAIRVSGQEEEEEES